MKKLFLTDHEIDRFYTAYCDIDADNSGFIRDDEFRAYFRTERNAINEKIFSMFDSDKSGFLNFFEFTCSVSWNIFLFLLLIITYFLSFFLILKLWNYLSYDVSQLGAFLFFLFDNDNGGTLDIIEVKIMLETLHKKGSKNNSSLSTIMNTIFESGSQVTVGEFVIHCQNFPMLINPILIQQLKLQKELIGELFWKKIVEKRKSHPEMLDPGFVIKVSDRAQSENRAVMKKLKIEQDIAVRRGKVSEKAALIRTDTRTQRRNSLILGIMNLKNKPEEKKREISTELKIDKIRNDLEDHELKLPSRQRRRKSITKPNLTMTFVANDDESEQQNLNKIGKEPSKDSQRKSRKTIYKTSAATSSESQTDGDSAPADAEPRRSHRQTVVNTSSKVQKKDESEGRETASKRNTIVSISSKKENSGPISLPPLKLSEKKSH